jgi:hypothetical protein
MLLFVLIKGAGGFRGVFFFQVMFGGRRELSGGLVGTMKAFVCRGDSESQ